MTLVRKFVKDLQVGDVVVDGLGFPPVLHYVRGEPVLHHTEVVGVARDVEAQVNFDPAAHNQEQYDASGMLAQPPVMHMRHDDREFPTRRVLLAGFENRERLDQAPVERNARLFAVVEVFEGDLGDLIEEGLADELGGVHELPPAERGEQG